MEGADRGRRGLKAWLGLGSNVGDRLANLSSAVEALPRHGVTVLAASSVYETEPRDDAVGQQDFLNAAIAVETELEPPELLAACKAVERELGREPGGRRHAARPIDVDLLMIQGREHRSDELTVPHAEILNRRFVLEPLLELDPPDRARLEAALPATRTQRVTRCSSRLT